MMNKMCITIACLITGLSLTAPVLGTEPIEEMRSFARMSVLVETRDQKGFCAAMVADPSYVGYVNRACQFAVKNKLKKPEDCSPENIAREISADSDQCLTMSAAEFKKSTEKWPKLREEFIKDAMAKGIDGEKLLQEERAKIR